jgi:hypothetical protein
MTTAIPKGRASDGKINISLNPETVAMLAELKDEMGKTLGFNLSYSHAIQHLVKFYIDSDFYKQRDKVSK